MNNFRFTIYVVPELNILQIWIQSLEVSRNIYNLVLYFPLLHALYSLLIQDL